MPASPTILSLWQPLVLGTLVEKQPFNAGVPNANTSRDREVARTGDTSVVGEKGECVPQSELCGHMCTWTKELGLPNLHEKLEIGRVGWAESEAPEPARLGMPLAGQLIICVTRAKLPSHDVPS